MGELALLPTTRLRAPLVPSPGWRDDLIQAVGDLPYKRPMERHPSVNRRFHLDQDPQNPSARRWRGQDAVVMILMQLSWTVGRSERRGRKNVPDADRPPAIVAEGGVPFPIGLANGA